MVSFKKAETRAEDRWNSRLPDGREISYFCARLPSGMYRISAGIDGHGHSHSKIVDYPVSRDDVEMVFLSDLMSLVE